MRLLSLLTSAVILLGSSALSRADGITTFTLTHGTDTFVWSIPQQAVVGQPIEFEYHVPLTINGVTQYAGVPGDNPSEGFEFLQPLDVGAEVYVGYAESPVNGLFHNHYLFEHGPQIYSIVNGVLTFTPGTITFTDVAVEDLIGTVSTLQWDYPGDTLVITQGDSSVPNTPAPTPEPSTLCLLVTGVLGSAGMVRRRFA